MRNQIKLKQFLFFGLLSLNMFGQKEKFDALENRLMTADKKAIFDVATYFDSKKEVTEFLGYHVLQTKESYIAKRLIKENCIFTEKEISLDSTNYKDFFDFLTRNKEKIVFSNLANAFLLTSLEEREANVSFREISKNRKIDLLVKTVELKNLDWVKSNQIDSLIEAKNPRSLLLIASELYKIRYRFDTHHYDKNKFTDLLQLLTGYEIGVENEKKELTWHIDEEFYHDASLNLLIYFSKQYSNYVWDNEKAIFVNPSNEIKSIGKEEKTFELLKNENNSIAMNAFIELTTCNPQKVTELAKEYEKARIKENYAIPMFPYRFLQQLVLLTDYCKNNNIDFKGTTFIQNRIDRLQSVLSFKERRQLEDDLINNLTLDEITSFEYWALINEKSYELTYSAGRILDVFYSKNWDKIMSNDKHIRLYLKKSILFDRLGIIGICNNYLMKFKNASPFTIQKVNTLQSNDLEILRQIEAAKKMCSIKIGRPNILKKTNDANQDYDIKNIKNEIQKLKNDDAEKYEDDLIELLSKINYNQIPDALEAIEGIKLKTDWKDLYSFMERDFGFFMIESFSDSYERNEFLKIYKQFSEAELYSFYLDKSGIDYKDNEGLLDFDKIYELLKYDVVTSFVGGGGGKKDNEVYSLIKILELKYKTTLGFPRKVCNSNGMYGCYSDDRAAEWMQYLIDHKLLKQSHEEPISFRYGID